MRSVRIWWWGRARLGRVPVDRSIVVDEAIELWRRAGEIGLCDTAATCEESILKAIYVVSYSESMIPPVSFRSRLY
jgi:hypothetical protein